MNNSKRMPFLNKRHSVLSKKQSFFGRLWRNLVNAVAENLNIGGLVHFNTSPLIAPSSSTLSQNTAAEWI